jgi:hypothetical protein
MICVRVANGMVGRYSTHSWGTAIDIRIAGQTDRIGDGRMFAGLAALGPYFEREGFYWGARRGGVGEESSHFEVSAQLLQQWASSGQLR